MSKLVAIIFMVLMVSAFAKVLDHGTDVDKYADTTITPAPLNTSTATAPPATTSSASGRGLLSMSTIFLTFIALV